MQSNLAESELRARTAIAVQLEIRARGGQTAVAAHLGCSQSQVSRMLSGVWTPHMLKLCDHAGTMPKLSEDGERIFALSLRMAAGATEAGYPVEAATIARALLGAL